MNIGNIIKNTRIKKGITQERLAEYLNISVSAVSQWECGKTMSNLQTTEDYKYTHKLYILDGYTTFAYTLSFFVLYYTNLHFSKRFHMSFAHTEYVKSWSFSRYNNKYDPKWRETNFPSENYFGKTSLFI